MGDDQVGDCAVADAGGGAEARIVLVASGGTTSDSPALTVWLKPGAVTLTEPSLTPIQVLPSSVTRTVQRVGCIAVTCPAGVVTL
jgi:hypothetical protein